MPCYLVKSIEASSKICRVAPKLALETLDTFTGAEKAGLRILLRG